MTDSKKKETAVWKRLVAGAASGCCNLWVCHPLDRIKTHLQNHPHLSLYQSARAICSRGKGFSGGLYAIYEGILPMTADACVKYALRFGSASWFRDMYRKNFFDGDDKQTLPAAVNAAAGAFAGTVECLAVTIPAELLKVRHMTYPSSTSFIVVFKDLIQNEGFFALYKGGLPTLGRQVTNHMIRFPTFFAITNWLKGGDAKKELSPVLDLLAGGIAGSVSTLINHPIDTVKTRMQKQGQNLSMLAVIRQIYAERGILAFWSGGLVRVLRVAPGQAIFFYGVRSGYESLGRFLSDRRKGSLIC